LEVDGAEIVSVDVDLGGDATLARYVLAMLGVILLIFAIRMWRKRDVAEWRS
jgi:hypothetical protein